MTDSVLHWEALRRESVKSDEFRFVGISKVVFPEVKTSGPVSITDPFLEFGSDPFVAWSLASHAPSQVRISRDTRSTHLTSLTRLNESESLAPILDVQIEDGAELDHIVLIESSSELDFFPRVRVRVATGGKANLYFVQKCRGHAQLRVEVLLSGESAQAQITSVLKGNEHSRFEHGIRVKHLAPGTSTQMDSLALLTDASHAVFRGQLEIAQTAPFSKAFEKSRALLLSPDAQFDVLPQLWIATSEVQCSHGASVSSFADEEKFYLATRGIPERESERILCAGLLKHSLSSISCTEHRLRAEEFLDIHSLSEEEGW